MKKLFVLALFFSFTSHRPLSAQTYSLNWASSFSSAWTNGQTAGTANNVGGSGINVSVSVIKTGGVFTNSGSGAATPTVSGSTLSVGGSSSNLEVGVDFNNHGEHVEITYLFSSPVTHVQFHLADIDKPSPTSNQCLDEITIQGAEGVATPLPTITRYDSVTEPSFLVISNNVAHINATSGSGGNSASSATDQRGTIIADFGSNLISTVTIRLKNVSSAQSNPVAQEIAIGNLSFQKPDPLPVVFTYIKAKAHSHETAVEWQTASEFNNSHFEVEKSEASGAWKKIGTVQPLNGPSSLKNYLFSDPVISTGTVHYRVKQVDQDGKSLYSQVVSVKRSHKHFIAGVYPNPVSASSVVSLYAAHNDALAVSVMDAGGRLLHSEARTVSAGTNEFSMDRFDQLPKGYYFLHLRNATGYSEAIRIFKM